MNLVEDAWEKVLESLEKFSNQVLKIENEEFKVILSSSQVLSHNDLFSDLYQLIIQNLKKTLILEIIPNFWKNFEEPPKVENVDQVIKKAFLELHRLVLNNSGRVANFFLLESYLNNEPLSPSDLQNKSIQLIKTILKKNCFLLLNKNYEDSLNIYLKNQLDLCDKIIQGCSGDTETVRFNLKPVVTSIVELKLFDVCLQEPLMHYISQKIQSHVQEICRSPSHQSHLSSIFDWVVDSVLKLTEEVFGDVLGFKPSPLTFDVGHLEKIKLEAAQIYSNLRIEQLFDLIIDFPDSMPVLQDLVTCISQYQQIKNSLVSSLKQALQTRLLHPGVKTSDILTAYISTMRALRVLDKKGIMLELAGGPVKSYLKSREDTVRCIVESLTEDSNNELAEELNKGKMLCEDDSDDETVDPLTWQHWEPDPVEAEMVKHSQASRSFDIISMLVNIYGSKELFIEEYRCLLADRILTQLDFEVDKEIKHLELLKLRFGENQLNQCEVMLKDVSDSRRINSQISEKKTDDSSHLVPIQGLVLSAQFWPPRLRDEKVQLAKCLSDSMDHYKSCFETLKGNRTLVWKPHLGLVNLDLEMSGKTINLNVSLIHASIIFHFQEKRRYTLDELGSLMHMSQPALLRKIVFWQNQGILRQEGEDAFSLVEELKKPQQEVVGVEEELVEVKKGGNTDKKKEEHQVVWSYVVGMLTNLETLSLDRIASMLKMFAMQGPASQITSQEIKQILEDKIKEGKLDYFNGLYKLSASK